MEVTHLGTQNVLQSHIVEKLGRPLFRGDHFREGEGMDVFQAIETVVGARPLRGELNSNPSRLLRINPAERESDRNKRPRKTDRTIRRTT